MSPKVTKHNSMVLHLSNVLVIPPISKYIMLQSICVQFSPELWMKVLEGAFTNTF